MPCSYVRRRRFGGRNAPACGYAVNAVRRRQPHFRLKPTGKTIVFFYCISVLFLIYCPSGDTAAEAHMLNFFRKFEGSPNGKSKEKARITLSPRRFFTLNAIAFRKIGSPLAVELYFDDHHRRIAMQECDPHKRNAFLVRKAKNKPYHLIYVGAFCQHFSISTKRTVLFFEPEVTKDGMLVLDMSKTTVVGRGSR